MILQKFAHLSARVCEIMEFSLDSKQLYSLFCKIAQRKSEIILPFLRPSLSVTPFFQVLWCTHSLDKTQKAYCVWRFSEVSCADLKPLNMLFSRNLLPETSRYILLPTHTYTSGSLVFNAGAGSRNESMQGLPRGTQRARLRSTSWYSRTLYL